LLPPNSFSEKVNDALSLPQFEIFSAILTLSASFLYALGTLPSVDSAMVIRAEEGISIFFGVEYLLRLYSKGFSIEYVMSPLALIDLVSFLPFLGSLFLPNSGLLDSLQLLRLLRILRLQVRAAKS